MERFSYQFKFCIERTSKRKQNKENMFFDVDVAWNFQWQALVTNLLCMPCHTMQGLNAQFSSSFFFCCSCCCCVVRFSISIFSFSLAVQLGLFQRKEDRKEQKKSLNLATITMLTMKPNHTEQNMIRCHLLLCSLNFEFEFGRTVWVGHPIKMVHYCQLLAGLSTYHREQ